MSQDGKRVGPGRPRHVPPLKERHLRITEAQAKLLRIWGRGDMSAGLRWLINAAEPLIRRKVEVVSPPEPDPPHSSE